MEGKVTEGTNPQYKITNAFQHWTNYRLLISHITLLVTKRTFVLKSFNHKYIVWSISSNCITVTSLFKRRPRKSNTFAAFMSSLLAFKRHWKPLIPHFQLGGKPLIPHVEWPKQLRGKPLILHVEWPKMLRGKTTNSTDSLNRAN